MNPPNFLILYVASPLTSSQFYADLLKIPPVESSPTYAMLPLANGTLLGLWSRETVEPQVTVEPGCSEVAFTLENDAEVDRCHAEWAGKGIAIAQAPTRMDFGYTFTGLDPDGHRLRVFAPNPR